MKFDRFDRFFRNSIPNVFENSFYKELFNSILKNLRQLERLQIFKKKFKSFLKNPKFYEI